MDVAVYKIDGSTAGKMTLPEELFGVEVNPSVVHEAVVAQDANARTRYAQTKDRSEVRGGGRKPWKQKGTGRARHGSRRSPIWIGGGITFGPLAARNFAKKINKRAKRKALAMVLSDKVQENMFIIVDDMAFETPKTKLMQSMRAKLPGADRSALVVAEAENKAVGLVSRNLPKTSAVSSTSVNVRDLLASEYVIVSKAAVEEMIKHYTK